MARATALMATGVAALERYGAFVTTAKGWRRPVIAIAAGIAAALALAPVYALPLMVVGFSTLILLLDGAGASARPRWRAFVTGWLFGFGYYVASIYWMAFSFFVQAQEFAWMAPFAVLGMPAFLGLFTGAAALCAHFVWRPGWRRIVFFAGAWMVFEYARGHVLTGLPWNLAGQALAGNAAAAQSAALYGAYGLTLVTVLIAAAPAAWLGASFTPRRAALGSAIALGAGALLFAGGAVRLALPEPAPDGETFLRIVQPNIAQRDKINPDLWRANIDRQIALSAGALPAGGRVFVIWPENSAPLLDEARAVLADIDETLPSNAVLLAGAVRREVREDGGVRFFNSIAIVPPTPQGRKAAAFYDKHHLVPFGEYLPLQGLLRAAGLAQLAPFEDGFTPGAGPRIMNAGGPSFAPLICYEVIFPGALYPRGQRPEWLLTVTNDAWFGDTSGPRQHLDQARLRAIETGLPMARSANTGISAVIDAKGRILARVKLYEAGRIDAVLPPALPPTLYAQAGDWLFFAMTALCLILGYGAHGQARGRAGKRRPQYNLCELVHFPS